MEYEKIPVDASCPACQQNQGYRLYRVNARQAAQHFVLQEADKKRHKRLKEHIRNLWNSDSCSVIQCRKCGLCFASPFIAGDSLFYELAFNRTHYPEWKWEFEITFSRLFDLKNKEYSKRDICLLEIGAGSGAFLKKIVPDIVRTKDIFATEYSSFGRESINRLEIHSTNKNILELNALKPDSKFDIICMFQVLEHMDHLDEIFGKLEYLTKPGAHFFFSVPNNKYIKFIETNGALLDMPPNHLTRWTHDAFASIAARHRLMLVEHAIQPQEKKMTAFSRFAKFFFLRRSQFPGTMANKITSQVKTPMIKQGAQGLSALFYVLTIPKTCLKLAKIDLPCTQWVHLRKPDLLENLDVDFQSLAKALCR